MNSNKNNHFKYNKIGLRLSAHFVFISLFFVVLSVFILWKIEFVEDQYAVEKDVKSAVDTVEKQLAKSLWDIDTDSIRITLNSLATLPIIKGASLKGNLEETYQVGATEGLESHSRRIVYRDEYIGDLTLFYSIDEIRSNAVSKFKYLLVFNAIAIFLMGAIFYVIVDRSIIRHISSISRAREALALNEGYSFEPLTLQRKARADELSDLVKVLNKGRQQAVELLQTKKVYQEQMEYQANYDLLTELPNRRHLYDYLKRQITGYSAKQGTLVVMFIDLDGFKQINDNLGHVVGDSVLKECAKRLKRVSESLSSGFIARLGGDEFILLLENIKLV